MVDVATLEEEFAKVNPHRRLAQRLYWMILGLLSWFVVWPLGDHVTAVSVYLAYTVGLQGVPLTLFALATALTTYALIGFLILRYLASRWHSGVMAKGIAAPLAVGVVAAGANMLLCWSVNFANHHLWQRLVPAAEAWRQITGSKASIAWYVTMMFLLATTLAVFARRSREPAEAQ